jgi:hypothetical protein
MRMAKTIRWLLLGAPWLLGCLLPSGGLAAQPDGTAAYISTVYMFTGPPDAAGPGQLLTGKGGTLYGTSGLGGTGQCTDGCGTVFKLTRMASSYTEKLLYAFRGLKNNDGVNPYGGVIADARGNLFGTTEYGGTTDHSACGDGCGEVYELSPTRSGYDEHILYMFEGLYDGAYPIGNLMMDRSGALYGTTTGGGSGFTTCDFGGCGTAFKLIPKGEGYTESVIYRFQNGADGSIPYGNLVEDSVGDLYGTTSFGGDGCGGYVCGTVFRLSPNGPASGSGTYAETILHAFTSAQDGAAPEAGLVADASGALYGTTRYGGGTTCADYQGCGTVFKLTPALTGYSERVVYRFKAPPAEDGNFPIEPLVLGKGGVIYGTTPAGGLGQGGGKGVAFALMPRRGGYVESLLIEFVGANGSVPGAGLTSDGEGTLYGTTGSGGILNNCNHQGCGVAFSIALHSTLRGAIGRNATTPLP